MFSALADNDASKSRIRAICVHQAAQAIQRNLIVRHLALTAASYRNYALVSQFTRTYVLRNRMKDTTMPMGLIVLKCLASLAATAASYMLL